MMSWCIIRSSCPKMFSKYLFLKNSQNSQENTCRGLFFSKVPDLKTLLEKKLPATLLEKRIQHKCFDVIFAKFLWKPFYRTHLEEYFCMISDFCNFPKKRKLQKIHEVLMPSGFQYFLFRFLQFYCITSRNDHQYHVNIPQ